MPGGFVELVQSGQVSEARIDVSARRLLRDKFRLGLFDAPMVDETAAQYGEVVDSPDEADYAILRLATPFEPRSQYMLEQFFHQGDLEGDLDFKEPEPGRLLDIMTRVPTIVDIYLERAAVIPEIAAAAVGLLASYSVSDAAALDVIFGRFAPGGRLPFELPRSMDAVRAQRSDMPRDSRDPLFAFRHGLSY